MRFAPIILDIAVPSRNGDLRRGSRRSRQARNTPFLELMERRTLLSAITEFPAPSPDALPAGIAAGIVAVPGGGIWFTEPGADKIAEISTAGVTVDYAIPTASSSPQGITFGPDGNLWFTEAAADKIGVISTSGTIVHEYAIPTAASNPQGITAGPDGDLWFTEAATGKIGKINPSTGVVTEYPVTTLGGLPEGITSGPDGNLWFTEPGTNQIGKIVPATGVVTEYPITTSGGRPQGITAGPDGDLWFTEAGAARVGKIVPATGAVTEYSVPTAGGVTEGIAAGSDGNLWFTEPGTSQVGRITPAGVVTEFSTPTGASQPWGITTGPDGNIWFTESGANKVGQVALARLIAATGTPVMAQAGSPFTATIATFIPAALNPQTTSFTATIDWGDGSPATTGTITAGPQGTFNVSATKTYTTAGTYQALLTIVDPGGATATANATITVAFAATGNTINAVVGQPFDGQVAYFSDPQTNGDLSQYSASINWGDNTTTRGVVTYTGGTNFTVSGGHTYAAVGVDPVTVTVTGPGGRTFIAYSQAVVADAPLSAVGVTSVATTGVPFTGVVATFSGGNPTGNYQATIAWGDGHTSAGTIVPPSSPGGYDSVSGTNTYMTPGTYTAQVTILDAVIGGSTATASSTIIAAYAATGEDISTVVGQAFNGQVASFSDPQTTGQVGQYSASINWGDGTTTNGVVAFTGGTDFTISGIHTWAAAAGVDPLTVTVTGPGGRTFIAYGQAVVAAASPGAIEASAAAIQPTAGVLFTGVVATFTDDNPTATATDFEATIAWGDGHTSTGTIAAPAGAGYFTVTGTNTYAAPGSYTLQVTINSDDGGTATTAPSTVNVGAVPVYLSGYLDPASISGPSKSVNITNVNRPTFQGITRVVLDGATLRPASRQQPDRGHLAGPDDFRSRRRVVAHCADAAGRPLHGQRIDHRPGRLPDGARLDRGAGQPPGHRHRRPPGHGRGVRCEDGDDHGGHRRCLVGPQRGRPAEPGELHHRPEARALRPPLSGRGVVPGHLGVLHRRPVGDPPLQRPAGPRPLPLRGQLCRRGRPGGQPPRRRVHRKAPLRQRPPGEATSIVQITAVPRHRGLQAPPFGVGHTPHGPPSMTQGDPGPANSRAPRRNSFQAQPLRQQSPRRAASRSLTLSSDNIR